VAFAGDAEPRLRGRQSTHLADGTRAAVASRPMRTSRLLLLSVIATLGGCTLEMPPEGDDEQALSDLGTILDGAPEDRGMSLAFDAKADETIPATFDLMDYQSPVRNQGSRGTCTIFATIGLMESLYIREGSIPNPDFSEQFLQWSAKTEVRSFQNSEGSNPQYNLQAINRHGIVAENLWPYETQPWGTTNDAMCTGESRPVRCYTNGEPPAAARMGQRYTLPQGRWINPSRRSLQGHMISTRTPVVASGAFFYQSWNHGRSMLRTNSEYQAQGYVLSPNEADIADSTAPGRGAGHGFVLVGWDDNLEVPRVDGMGEPEVDAMGNPVMERGFFLFKNSWGDSGRFGSRNPHGGGYGWISYAYVEEHLTAYVAGLPTGLAPREQCGDGIDNDRDMQIDCADSDCASQAACMDPGNGYENTTDVAIPDNSATGASSTITVTEGGNISSLSVTVDIVHTYTGDLSVRLVRESDGREALLVDRQGGSADNIARTFAVSAFNGTDAAGTWRLVVRDHAAQDTGTLSAWSMDITRCMGTCGSMATTRTFTDSTPTAIPDNNRTGISRTLAVDSTGSVTELSVTVDITHPYPSDLAIRIARVGGREIELTPNHTGTGIQQTFTVSGFVGDPAAGDWRLTVVDRAAQDVGTLNSWSLTVGAM
jgi:subtilisin-like proprotein convertase family protein